MRTPSVTIRHGVGAALVALTAVMPVSAQDNGDPVDIRLADNPRAVSFRKIDQGNAQFSFRNRLTVADFNANWSPGDPASPTATDPSTGLVHSQDFQYRSPGVRALIDSPEFARIGNGPSFMLIPANTVFQLTPENQTAAASVPTPPPAHENYVDQRLDLSLSNSTSASLPGGRLDRVSISELTPIPQASQMRFPQAAYPDRLITSEPGVAEEAGDDTAATEQAPEAADGDQENTPALDHESSESQTSESRSTPVDEDAAEQD